MIIISCKDGTHSIHIDNEKWETKESKKIGKVRKLLSEMKRLDLFHKEK